MVDDETSQVVFKFGSRAISHATCNLLGNSPYNVDISMSQNQRAPGRAEIKVTVAINVIQIRPRSFFDEAGSSVD
jgi:hypothetical protein